MKQRMMRKTLSWALTLTMVLTMLPDSVLATATGESEAVASEASAELFATYNYLEASIVDTTDTTKTVSETSAKFNPDSAKIIELFIADISAKYNDGTFATVFADSSLDNIIYAGIQAYDDEISGIAGAWTAYIDATYTADSDLKTIVRNAEAIIAEMTINQAYTMTYGNYVITMTRKTHSTGSGGGSGVGPSTGDSTPDGSLVVLDVYQGLDANGAIVDMMHVLYADGRTGRVARGSISGFNAYPCEGCVYLYNVSNKGEVCLATVPTASGTITGGTESQAFALAAQDISKNAKSLTVGAGRAYFADECKFFYVWQDDSWEWQYFSSDKLQDISRYVPVYAVIDTEGNISALYILGVRPESTVDLSELMFIAGYAGTTKKVDKNGKLTTVFAYDAFIDGSKVEGVVSRDALSKPGFFVNGYNADLGWYSFSNAAYDDSSEAIKVTDAETFTKNSLAVNKYIVVDGNYDVELTSDTKYATNIPGKTISTLTDLKELVSEDGSSATIYVVYDFETGEVLYVYVTEETTFSVDQLVPESLVVLDRYQGLTASGKIADMMEVLYSDGTVARVEAGYMDGFTAAHSASEGCVYLYDMNEAYETCLQSVPTARAKITASDAGKTYFLPNQTISANATSVVTYSNTHTALAEDCRFFYVAEGDNGEWVSAESKKLQEIAVDGRPVSAAAVIDADGKISTLLILGVAAEDGTEIGFKPFSVTANIVSDHIVLFVESPQEITTQVLHIALYSEAGQMLDYIIVPTVKPFTTTNVVFDDVAAVKTAKVFLWDSLTTTTPIADAVEVTIR